MTLIRKLKRWVGAGDAGAQAAGGPGPGSGQGDARLHVLMVCTGNICRSPMAEGVLRGKLQAAGLHQQVVVDSAGTHGYHTSEAPDPRAIRVAAQRGYDIKALRARPVDAGDFEDFDWILALDAGHLAWLQKKRPEGHPGKVELLMTHASRHAGTLEVPDPYYGPEAGFEHVLDLVEDACDGVVARMLADAGCKT